ncbi:hypothetical protein DH2020_011590 [Rehmannia glutinosa]|uniref:EF-hand domain-containing protein n=1 Tax=Rehmannia glutinosa TaxID=99300 RepID=A0ABR0XDW3_REHGL
MRRQPKPSPLLTVVVFLILCGLTYGRFISDQSDLVSDGVHSSKAPQFIRLFAAEEACEQTYGFMPCTSTALGNCFLILVYGYLMFLAATYLSTGSELLLEILGPGIVGGLFLPILGALPDAMLILVSGLSGSPETAQSQVSVGMGLLAGSTVMLLTVIWGTCIIVGKCDIENDVAVDSQDTKGFSLTGSGITTDIWTSYAGIIMAVSVVPFIIVQFPKILHSDSGRHLAVLIGLIASVSLLISYCLYQVFQPWVQRRKLAYAKHKHVISGILKHLKMRALGKLSTDGNFPQMMGDLMKNTQFTFFASAFPFDICHLVGYDRLFEAIDDNHDGYLSHAELRALVVGIQFNELNLDQNDAIEKVMKDFDITLDSKIDFREFTVGVARWLEEARGGKASHNAGSMKYIDEYHMQTKREHDLLGDQSDEVVEGVEDVKWTSIKAGLLLLLGTIIAAAFADPLVDALYGAVTMNNVLCLSVFLALVYVRGLDWDFSSEVLVILIVCVVMGVFASIRTTFPLWTALVAFTLYPFSLALVYVLDYVFGWS